jgi:soluble lytic murein transglycosylase-like protein
MNLRKTTVPALMLALLVMGSSSPVDADIYIRIHSDGRQEFSNAPSGPGWMFHMSETGWAPVVKFATKSGKPKSIDEIVADVSDKFDIEASLVKAIIMAESNCNPDAVSRKGAQGLMQLMPDTARELNVSNTFDPRENIVGGVRYIKGLMASYGNLKLALAAYNAGPGAVKRYMGIPPYRETETYVKRVISYYRKFKDNPDLKLAGN